MSATSGGGGSVSEGSEAGESSQSTMSVGDSPSTSFQAKHAENVTKITLSDEIGAGGLSAEVAGSKINLTLDERQQKDGIINMAFDHEEGGNRSSTGGGGADFKSANGSDKKDKVPEAVNLELVNMVPYSNGNGTSYGVPVNGIPMKKDSEQVDMSTPYDEYFVPVNEHKKYMRGEKLYVTKDKRRPTSWRRCLSWIVACTVITVVLIVAILAGTGVILSQDQNLVKEASVGRNFAGSNLKPSVTQKSSVSPTDMTHIYVPRSIESELIIDNLDFDPALENANSSAYQQFASTMEDQLKMILFDKETLEFGASDIGLRVVNISRDPFKVNYRIGWNYKKGVNNPPEPIKMEDVKRRLVESLARNQGYIDKYHVDREAIKVNHVTNSCQMDNGGCSHICYYNYITQQFSCTCPTHLVLDSSNKNCVAWTGFSEDDAVPVPAHTVYPGVPYEMTASPGHEKEFDKTFEHELHHGVHHQLEHQYEGEASPEPTPEPAGKDHFDDMHHKEHEPVPEPTAEPAPEPTPEPNLDHKYGSHVDLEAQPEPTPEPTSDGNNGSHFDNDDKQKSDDHGHDYKHVVHSEYESSSEPAPEPSADGKDHEAVPEPTAEPTINDHEPAPEPAAEPAPEPAAEPTPEPAAEPAPEPTAEPAPEPAAEPAPEPTAEPAPEPTAESDSASKQDHHTLEHGLHGGEESKDQEPAPEPTAEPSPDSKEHEPAAEPTPEPSPENDGKVYSHQDFGMGSHPASDVQEHSETTVHPLTSSGHQNISEHGSDGQYLLPNQEQGGVNESVSHQTEHPELGSHDSGKHEPESENTATSESTGHHRPYLEDILIKDSSLHPIQEQHPTENSTTIHEYNPLENVEVQGKGEPVIEEIIINKSNPTEQHDSNMGQTVSSNNHSTDHDSLSKPVILEGSNDHAGSATEHPQEKSPMTGSVIVTEHHESNMPTTVQPPRTENPELTEDVTAYPKIIEYNSGHDFNFGMTEDTNRASSGKPENDQNSDGNKNIDQEQDPKLSTIGHPEGATTGSDVMTSKPESENQGSLSTETTKDTASSTTMLPDIQPESFTIPVSIFGGILPQTTINITEPVQQHNQSNAGNSNVEQVGPHPSEEHNQNETPVETNKETLNDKTKIVLGNDGLEHGKTRETTTESQTGVTESYSDLVQKMGEKNMNDSGKKMEGDSSKTGDEPNHTTVNINSPETESNDTKLNEELSNNIKDEGLENEEFNTLLDPEYKSKEEHTNESKESLLNKYPNKALKTDKKKLKDYVKGDKTDADKKGAEGTARPAATPKDFILQKHVNGNENTFYPDYSLQNEHTTKHDGDVLVIGPHEVDGVPGVSLRPHGIDNHDLSVLQTVSPDFRTETVFPGESDLKVDAKGKPTDAKDGDSKLEKEYPKFDKDYKYDKQKGSKKKDLKKKGGGKDGKNVELEDGRKLFTEVDDKDDLSKDFEVAHEVVKDILETTIRPSFEGDNVNSEPGKAELSTDVPQHKGAPELSASTIQPGEFTASQTTTGSGATEETKQLGSQNDGAGHTYHPDLSTLILGGVTSRPETTVKTGDDQFKFIPVDQNGHLMIDEPAVKNRSYVTPGTVYDGQLPGMVNFTDPNSRNPQTFINLTPTGEQDGSGTVTRTRIPGTVFDGAPQGTTISSAEINEPTVHGRVEEGITNSGPRVVEENLAPTNGIEFSNSTVFVTGNSTTAHPTIIVHGQSGSLQDGHVIRFANSTFPAFGNGTTVPSGTVTHPDGQSFTFTNVTTFPNGSVVHPTIVIRGQSGALQDGHEVRFANSTFQTFVTPAGVFDGNPTVDGDGHRIFIENSTVYRIENGSLPGTVFDGHFNPTEGHYHMFTNSSGTFVYTNSTAPPSFVIKGESGDFGNARAYILGNSTSFTGPERTQTVIFRNSTVFAVGNATGSGVPAVEIQEVTIQPGERASNETIQFTHQMTPNTFLSGTTYKVNNYFGYVSKCAAGQFQCLNGTSRRGSACISLSSKCDSINDCSDGSDELGCIENGCPGNFQCSDGTCLKRNLVCNGIVDCSDGSDEKQCESWKCEFDEFQCPSGRCIPIVWQCDGKPDCDNHTDEYHCQTSCGNDEYLCPEGWCIPLTYKCNGIKECSNGEDEQLCDCSHDEFKCQTGGCISKSQVCNGLDDCPDRSDEWGCVKIEPDTSLLKIRTPSGNYEPVCADNWSSQRSDELCASLGYYSSAAIESGNGSSLTTETSFYVLKNDTTADFNKKLLVNLVRTNGECGKLVEISCQEFSCGSRSMTDSSSVEARFVGGMSATAGQWPSVALLYNIRNFHSCTANVLTPRWVLASYNCLKSGNKNLNEQDWKLFGGSTVFEAEKENTETRRILSIVPHPQVKFNQFLFSNDLALVELDQPLHFTSNIGAVCLPEQEIQPRQICVTAGWGMNTPEDKSIKQQLQYLPVPTMNLTECNSTEHYSGFITDDKICAGFNTVNKSLCYNEEGAPLMCVNDRGEWELQGVLSYHSNCGRGSHPSIFSSITPVRDWIKKTIGNSFDRKMIAATKR